MAEAIEYEQFEQATEQPGLAPEGGADLSRLSDIPMELSVEIGRTHMTVGETLDLRVGSVVALERLAGEAADLLVNGTAIARGEVVVVDEQYGLRVTEILDGRQDGEAPPSAMRSEGGRPQEGEGQEAVPPAPSAVADGVGEGQEAAPPAPSAVADGVGEG